MVDTKAATGTVLTAGIAGSSWLDIAEPIVTIFMAVLVGSLTAWYTWEKAMQLRRERKDSE